MIEQIEMNEDIGLKAVAIHIREFLRFCGILVNYSSAEAVKNSISFKVLKRGCDEPKECSIMLMPDEDYNQSLEKVMLSILDDSENEEKEVLEQLKKIFVDNQLCYHIYNLIHFHTIREVMKEAYDGFRQAYISIGKECKKYTSKEKDIPFSMIYAKILCAKRVNEICNLLGEIRLFRTDKIFKELQIASEQYKVDTVANYLMGQILFVDPAFRNDSNICFEKALNDRIGNYFKSNIYYYMGVNTQWMEGRLGKNAAEFYMNSLRENKRCYRASYKLGMYYFNLDDSELAKKQFYHIINSLEEKREYLQPIEKLYLFKAYERLARIVGELEKNIEKARQYEKAAMDLYESSIEKDAFIERFYGEKSSKFKVFLNSRFKSLKAEQTF